MGKKNNIKKGIYKVLLFVLGIVISSIAFNVFFIPNNFISSGLTGIAVILANYSDITPVSVLFFGNMILIGLCIITLGLEKTTKYIIGALLFTLVTYLTEDINAILNIHIEDMMLAALASGICMGIGEGLIYKAGYSSGGISIMALILAKYIKKPVGDIYKVIGVLIIVAGGFTFGLEILLYSIIIILILTYLVNKITLGISDSKMFLIYTTKEIEVIDYMMNNCHNGITKILSKGVYSNKKKNFLMCVVSTDKYTKMLEEIKEIDSNAFISISDCYEVYGGTKREKLPFMMD